MIKKLTPALISLKNLFFKQGEIIDYLNNSSSFTYEIGQYVPSEGGVIAHRWLSTSEGGSPTAGTVQNYLVVDTVDLSSGALWASQLVDISNAESTWDGATNTANLIAAGAGGGITVGTAAVLCNSSTNNSKSDWYLPAIDELRKIWDNKLEIAQGLQVANGTMLNLIDGYWSSTEITSALAFGGGRVGSFGSSDKDYPNYVRAMRKFSI